MDTAQSLAYQFYKLQDRYLSENESNRLKSKISDLMASLSPVDYQKKIFTHGGMASTLFELACSYDNTILYAIIMLDEHPAMNVNYHLDIFSPIYFACRSGPEVCDKTMLLTKLLSMGANVNVSDFGITPLKTAKKNNNWRAMKLLLEHGALK